MDEEKVYLDEAGLTRVLGKDREYVDEKDGYRAIDTTEGTNSSSTGDGFFITTKITIRMKKSTLI